MSITVDLSPLPPPLVKLTPSAPSTPPQTRSALVRLAPRVELIFEGLHARHFWLECSESGAAVAVAVGGVFGNFYRTGVDARNWWRTERPHPDSRCRRWEESGHVLYEDADLIRSPVRSLRTGPTASVMRQCDVNRKNG